MPPKKKMKLDAKQKTLSFFKPHIDINNNISDSTEDTDTDNSTVTYTTCDADSETATENAATVTATRSIVPRAPHSRWEKLWPWLYCQNGQMFCRLCSQTGKKNTMTRGCTTYKTSSMTRHEETEDHKSAANAGKLSTEFTSSVQKACSEEEEGIVKAIKAVYWLASENVALSKYEQLMKLMKDLECPKLDCLKIGKRVDYESYYTAKEIISAISEQIDAEINKKLQQSPFVTLLSDESTDISNTKRMTINARIIDPKTSITETVYLRNVEYEDGTGEGLASVLLQELVKRNIPTSKLMGFGSDGASVMTGEGKGVKGRLMQHNPHLIHIHCMAHRLALCTSQAASDIPLLTRYQEWLTSLFYYLKVSATREKELHKVQEVLDYPVLKYKEIHAVRWLSCYQAVEAVYRTLDPLITYLHQRQAAKDPKSKGLLKSMATTQFIYITYLMMDVLPVVSRLCLQLQTRDLDIVKAKLALDQCLSDLHKFKDGTQSFEAHTGTQYDTDVTINDDKYQFNGHIILSTNANLPALKSQFVNRLIANINKRFPQKSLINNFFILSMRTLNMETNPDYGKEEVEELLKHFGEEKVFKGNLSPAVVSKAAVRQEWDRAKGIVLSLRYPVERMDHLWELLSTHHAVELPNLLKIAQIALCLPLHTADCERTFSQQNQILTKQRNRLRPESSDQLLRVRLHGETYFDVQKTLTIWKTNKKRILMSQ